MLNAIRNLFASEYSLLRVSHLERFPVCRGTGEIAGVREVTHYGEIVREPGP